jgi:hypothetical protein
MDELVRELTKLPVTVLNSHTHFDHVGGNADFPDVWNEDTPFSRANADGHLEDYARTALDPDHLCAPLPDDVHSSVYKLRPWQVSHRVADGERIELGGRTLEVIYSPGHAPDSLCLLDREDGLLFTGDVLSRADFCPGTSSLRPLAGWRVVPRFAAAPAHTFRSPSQRSSPPCSRLADVQAGSRAVRDDSAISLGCPDGANAQRSRSWKSCSHIRIVAHAIALFRRPQLHTTYLPEMARQLLNSMQRMRW